MRILRGARRDIAEARNWYHEQQAGVELRFLDRLADAMRSIESDPSRLAIEESNTSSRDVRYESLRKFPYRIIFELTESGDVHVLAVAHHRRRPGFWSERETSE